MYIKQFKNGNFNISRDLMDSEKEQTFIEWVCEIANSKDFTMASEDFGFSTSVTLYNYNTEMFYSVDLNDNIKYDKGETVKIIGFKDVNLYEELVQNGIL